ncbi:peptidase M20 domain-containing protein 2 [Nephila pilipes]|uniref:Peptidase M20 domain-containing protein 2 n=1 Tax=Nephila pilipes TaxID=299642 RepID=A0A8X6TRV3_NEPPI|nr:peptidase M20 domain-containing protein 2 [Nephila pilipes]
MSKLVPLVLCCLQNSPKEALVEKHTSYQTLKAEHLSKGGPVIAIILEYDALPGIGHACGHNLIAEAGLAAGLAIKEVMEADPKLEGKLLVLGTPAEERRGGKIDLLDAGVFQGVDAAMMVHPSMYNATFPSSLSRLLMDVHFKGKEAHASAFPWEGRNALDAAVAAYQNIALLRQHMKPSNRVHVIITKGGVAPNVIPAEAALQIYVRSASRAELKDLTARIKECVKSGAAAAGCSVYIECDEKLCYENLVNNKVMGNIYDIYAPRLGLHPTDFSRREVPSASTDMGNVSHVIPSIQTVYDINTEIANHTKEFTEVSGNVRAQGPTLSAAKALAMTALTLMKFPDILEEAKKQFMKDIDEGL